MRTIAIGTGPSPGYAVVGLDGAIVSAATGESSPRRRTFRSPLGTKRVHGAGPLFRCERSELALPAIPLRRHTARNLGGSDLPLGRSGVPLELHIDPKPRLAIAAGERVRGLPQ